jgi:hypothetical protein
MKESGNPTGQPDTPAEHGGAARQRPPQPAYPEFTRRLLLVMALFALCLKLVNVALGAMLVPEAAIRMATLLMLLTGLGYLVAYYFRLGPFRPISASDD